MSEAKNGQWHYYHQHDRIPAWTLDAIQIEFHHNQMWVLMPEGYDYGGTFDDYRVGANPVSGPRVLPGHDWEDWKRHGS